MPRAGPQTAVERRAAPVVVGAQREAGTLVLTWGLSRRGAAACGLVGAQGAGGLRLEVELPCRGEVVNGAVRAALIDGPTRRMVPAQGCGAWMQDSGLWHLDIRGLLCICLRERCGAVEVLYARTELLGGLGLEGGRYEFEAGSAHPARPPSLPPCT